MRIGHGYDAHRLAAGRKLILGGCEIEYDRGLEGHSDADVLTHAIIDALLGAAGLGDIGRNFPDSDEAYRDISSIILLKKVAGMLAGKGFCVENVDATIIAQRPRLADALPLMGQNVAEALSIGPELVNIKATTEEGMGFTGREEGIAAHAVVLLCNTVVSDQLKI